jgi:ATP-dependent DNA helicase RecG
VFLEEIETPVSVIAGVGPKIAQKLAKLGILTVGDLISYYPRAYDDRTKKIPISLYKKYPKVHTIAQVYAHGWIGFGRTRTLKIAVTDDSVPEAFLVAFNRPYLERKLPVGAIISVTGSFSYR